MATPKVTKSFQNCAESEVAAYNDCPSFLFQVGKSKSSRRHKITTKVRDVSGNTMMPSAPPPPHSGRFDKKTVKSSNSEATHCYSKEQVLAKISTLLEKESSLSAKELEFYRLKVENNVANSLESNDALHIFSQFFNEMHDKNNAKNLLVSWIISDTTISTWCPALLKIYENAFI
ncbi:hypothetical protein KAFR_0A07130 [Kazachstania africana CBS 2517]|uniref:Uncharacterized protein n=1 Tax=Kazachstania africana (strain ATCC 22294 / BCRC 22015 / CBS 2517 / CECT 1963 / NBRC 1671 / NRRL Y-8276) TaxID=1071382 RepID=H2AP47_KAZAF|nr:hypothetical protein KAFR_0A07130 [Kazachstania africana CBS 2517]CCF56147.1 hypothetical protein KAFR_0A07130 [Kazachstania africana CBS 2517]